MSRIKTLITVSIVSLQLAAPTARAQSPNDQLRLFATCAGRLSALMEFQWMFDGEGSERTKSQRETVLQLLDAVMPPDDGREVLHWRLSAKLAHSALLTRATFNDNQADASWAHQQATRLTHECTGILLS